MTDIYGIQGIGSSAAYIASSYKMINDIEGVSVTVQKDGTLYFNDVDASSRQGLLWTGSCPLGACGAKTGPSPSG